MYSKIMQEFMIDINRMRVYALCICLSHILRKCTYIATCTYVAMKQLASSFSFLN